MKCIWVLFFLLSIPFVSGLTTQTVTLYSTDSINFEGYNIYIEANVDYSIIKVQIDDYTDFINTGLTGDQIELALDTEEVITYSKTSSSRLGPVKVSLITFCANLQEKNCARVNPITLWSEPGYELFLEFDEPELNIKRSLSQNTAWIDEEVTLQYTVENTGDEKLTNVLFTESFPLTTDIIRENGWEKVGAEYEYAIPFLNPGDSKTFQITFSLNDFEEFTSLGTYSYTYKGKFVEDVTSTSTLTLTDLYDVSFSFDSSVYDPGDKATATVVITPKIDEEFLLDLEVLIPPDLKTYKGDFLVQSGGLYQRAILDEKDTLELEFQVEGKNGIFDMILFTNATYLKKLPVEFLEKKITFGRPGEDLTIEILLSEEHILDGEPITGEIFVTSSEDTEYDDLFFNFTFPNTSNVSQTIFQADYLKGGDFISFPFDYFTGTLNLTRAEQLQVTGSYAKTKDFNTTNETFSISSNLFVYIPDDALQVIRSVSPQTVEQNKTALVKVEIKNLLDERRFDLYAKDTVPEELLEKDVKRESQVYLLGGERKLLYSYELRMPYFIPNDSTLTTEVSSENFRFEDSTTLKSIVTLKEPSLAVVYKWSPLFVGRPSQLEATLTNNGDILMSSSQLDAPLFQGMDLLSDRTVSIPKLDPNEKITFFFDYLPKTQGEESSEFTSIEAFDEYGNFFRLNDFEVDVSVDSGEGCGLLGSVTSDSKRNGAYAMRLVFTNTCDEEVDLSISKPSLFISIDGGESKTIQYSEVIRGDLFEGVDFMYLYSGEERYSTTNDFELTSVKEEEVIQESFDTPSRSSSSDRSRDSFENEDNRISLEVSETSLILWDKIIGITAIIIIVFIGMIFLFKFSQKKSEEKPNDSEDFDDDSVIPPSVSDGMEAVGLFVDDSLKKGIPRVKIEEQLHFVGWDKQIIDKYVGGKQ